MHWKQYMQALRVDDTHWLYLAPTYGRLKDMQLLMQYAAHPHLIKPSDNRLHLIELTPLTDEEYHELVTTVLDFAGMAGIARVMELLKSYGLQRVTANGVNSSRGESDSLLRGIWEICCIQRFTNDELDRRRLNRFDLVMARAIHELSDKPA